MTISDETINHLVDRFLMWPLPQTVNADVCATDSNYAYPRSGTNLLSVGEARKMIVYLLEGLSFEKSKSVDGSWIIERWYGQGGPYYWTLRDRGDGRRIADKTGSWLALRKDAFVFQQRDDAEAMLQVLGGIGRIVEAPE